MLERNYSLKMKFMQNGLVKGAVAHGDYFFRSFPKKLSLPNLYVKHIKSKMNWLHILFLLHILGLIAARTPSTCKVKSIHVFFSH